MIKFIKNNWFIILLVLIILIYFIITFVNRKIEDSKIYESPDPTYYISIKHYDDNIYEVKNVSEVDVYRKYYKDFMYNVVNDKKKAWDLITDNCKKSKFKNDFDYFVLFTNKLNSNLLLSSDVKEYAKGNNGEFVVLVDTTDASYSFYENGVWNYKVSYN